jgi:hypothetical protein
MEQYLPLRRFIIIMKLKDTSFLIKSLYFYVESSMRKGQDSFHLFALLQEDILLRLKWKRKIKSVEDQ